MMHNNGGEFAIFMNHIVFVSLECSYQIIQYIFYALRKTPIINYKLRVRILYLTTLVIQTSAGTSKAASNSLLLIAYIFNISD